MTRQELFIFDDDRVAGYDTLLVLWQDRTYSLCKTTARNRSDVAKADDVKE